MANAIYPKAKEKFLDALIDIPSDTIKIALIDTGTYTYNSADEFWSSASSAIVGTAATLASKTITNGVFDAADTSWTTSTITARGAVLYKERGGADSANELLCYIDFGSDKTSSGGTFQITWHADGILYIG